MMEHLRDKEHLIRMAALFLAGILFFFLLQALLVPAGFGKYGHYRAGALADNRGRPLHFAGRQACEDCHSDVAETRKGSKHERVACEACHGPQAGHASADDPAARKPPRPNAVKLCLVCHAENQAKPAGFPQVNPREHGEGAACGTCHNAHHPEISSQPAPEVKP